MKYIVLTLVLLSSALVANPTPNWFINAKDSGWNSEFLAKTYFHNSELQRQWAWEALGKYSFSGSETVLDFGCGDGKITAEIARLVSRSGSVVGVDASKEMISFANKKFPHYAFTNLTFKQTESSLFDETLEDGPFDVVTAFCVFHLVQDPKPLLINIKKQLKKDGLLIMTIPAGNNPAFYQAAEEMFEKYKLTCPWSGKKQPGIPTMRSVAGARSLLEESGYKEIDVSLNSTDTAFYDRDELITWTVGTLSANWQIPVEKSYLFFSDVINKMIELCPECIDSEGRVLYKCDRVHVVART